jgi:2-(1,2-epoxy-1,2-dihydrophenyl)acetyl-CoA isomerase
LSVRLEVDGGVARVTLARPDAGNAIDLATATELLAVASTLAGDDEVRAVLLAGEGRNFCVGGDLRAFAAADGLGAHLREVTTPLHAAIAALARLPAPVVAAVQGSAAGAGMSLALGADLVVCAASARFVLAYGRVGLSPDGGGSWYLPRLVGVHRALDLALTNRALTAAEAEAWGIVTAVVPDEELEGRAEDLVRRLAAAAPGASAAAKRLLRASLDTALEAQLADEQAALVANADRHGGEGIAAFLAKRDPDFTGDAS